MPYGESGRCCCKHRHHWKPLAVHDDCAGEHATGESAEPAHSAATQEEIEKWSLAEVLHDPKQLRAGQPADDSGDGCVDSIVRQVGAPQFSAKHPYADQGGERDENAEAGDFEAADSKQNRIHLPQRCAVSMVPCETALDAGYRLPPVSCSIPRILSISACWPEMIVLQRSLIL